MAAAPRIESDDTLDSPRTRAILEFRKKILNKMRDYSPFINSKQADAFKRSILTPVIDEPLAKYLDTDFIDKIADYKKDLMDEKRTLNWEEKHFFDFVRDLMISSKNDEKEILNILTRCKKPMEKDRKLSFNSIAGMEQEKEDIKMQFIYPFEYKGLFKEDGTKGILLYGPPGTGKTFLAKITASAIEKAAYFAPSPGELLGKYEGETQKNITAQFECAMKYIQLNKDTSNQSIIFFDEFDSIAAQRGEKNPGAERSVNTLLQMMDGIKSNNSVAVIANTNLLSRIDEGILSRFPVKIFVDLPDNFTREWIIRNELSKFLYIKDTDDKEYKKTVISTSRKKGIDAYYALIRKYGLKSERYKIKDYIMKGKDIFLDKCISPEFILSITKKLGPSNEEEVKKAIKGQGRRTNDDEFTDSKQISEASKWGYSARDILSFMKAVIAIATSRVITRSSQFLETKIGEKTYYIYKPVGKKQDLVDDKTEDIVELGSGFLPESSYKKLNQIPFEAKEMIVSFDIRESDFNEAFSRTEASVKDYVQYTMVPEDA